MVAGFSGGEKNQSLLAAVFEAHWCADQPKELWSFSTILVSLPSWPHGDMSGLHGALYSESGTGERCPAAPHEATLELKKAKL